MIRRIKEEISMKRKWRRKGEREMDGRIENVRKRKRR